MFNSSVRQEALEKLDGAVNRYESIRKSVERASVRLFKQRQRAAGEVIERVEEYVNLLANSPKEFDKSVAQYRIEANRFDGTVRRLETEAIESKKIAGATSVAGGYRGCGSCCARSNRGHGGGDYLWYGINWDSDFRSIRSCSYKRCSRLARRWSRCCWRRWHGRRKSFSGPCWSCRMDNWWCHYCRVSNLS